MQRRTLTNLGILAVLATTTIVPAFGVVGLIAIVLMSVRILGYGPARRMQMSWVLAALPSPVSIGAVITAPLAWWERGVLAVALLMPWIPGDPLIRWALVLMVGGIPLYRASGLRVLGLIPVLHMAATVAWPTGLDTLILVLALCVTVFRWWRGDHAQLWAAVGMALCGLNSSAALAVLPWAVVCSLVPLAILAAWTWWGVLAALASGGFGIVAGLAMVPLLERLQQVSWRMGRWVVVILVWCAIPVTSSVARLQTSLTPYGVLYSDDALAVADATQRIVAHLPWQTLGLVGVLVWATWMQWRTEVQHA